MFLKQILLKEIKENHVCTELRKIQTDEIYIKVNGEDVPLYDIMYQMKLLNCEFKFKFSTEKMEIVLACILQTGYILALFVIQKKDESYWAHHVCVNKEQKEVSERLWDSVLQ